MAYDLGFGLVCSCDLDEDIASIQRDLGQFTVDDWWKRANVPIGIEYDRVQGRVADDGQEFGKMAAGLIFLSGKVSCAMEGGRYRCTARTS